MSTPSNASVNEQEKQSVWIEMCLDNSKTHEGITSEQQIYDFVESLKTGVETRFAGKNGGISLHSTMLYIGKATTAEFEELLSLARHYFIGAFGPVCSDKGKGIQLEKFGTPGDEDDAYVAGLFDVPSIESVRAHIGYFCMRLAERTDLPQPPVPPSVRPWNPHLSLFKFANIKDRDSFFENLSEESLRIPHKWKLSFLSPMMVRKNADGSLRSESFFPNCGMTLQQRQREEEYSDGSSYEDQSDNNDEE